MIDNKDLHSEITYYGEGGYGKCKNNKCTFETKSKSTKANQSKNIDLKERKQFYTADD